MGITRYENLIIKNVTNGVSSIGEQTTTVTSWFETRGLVHAIANSLRITDRYRVYSDVVQVTLNYTPNTRTIQASPHLYSIYWNGYDWRINEVRQTDDRMKVVFMCVRNDPTTAV